MPNQRPHNQTHFSLVFGFSLLEVMVAVALISGLTLFATRISYNQSGSTQRVYAHDDILHFLETYSFHLSDQGNCTKTLQTLRFRNSPVSDHSKNIPAIKDAAGATVFTPGSSTFGRVTVTGMTITVDTPSIEAIEQRATVQVSFSYTKNGQTQSYLHSFSSIYVILEDDPLDALTGPSSWKQVKRCYGLKERYASGVCSSIGGVYQLSDGACTEAFIPSKTVAAFYLANCPTGWSLADNSPGRTDIRGRFMRALNSGLSIDPDGARTEGSFQDFQVGSHQHSVTSLYNTHNCGAGSDTGSVSPYTTYCKQNQGSTMKYFSTFNTTSSPTAEMRPSNIALTICIKD
ncbi:MAG: type II secretion system protein [Oligoflexia bacterium]|nr:type II secretion system protein [Oligoflexia bacterium]